jgi:glycosidase
VVLCWPSSLLNCSKAAAAAWIYSAIVVGRLLAIAWSLRKIVLKSNLTGPPPMNRRISWPRRRIVAALAAAGAALALHGSLAAPAPNDAASVYDRRDQDWRNGAVVYQVIVDRFVPSADLKAKRALYPAPKVLHPWTDVPSAGTYLEDQKLNSAELDFWGGDLRSTASKVAYVKSLGADVVYLNPIHLAYTNHKYDAFDYREISPEYGTRADFRRLADDVHAAGMKLVLDGVFNHMGRNAPRFQDAFNNPDSPWRDWFVIGPQYKGGARVWTGFQNLPELDLENPAVQNELWGGRDSVVRGWLRDGADGWRLDTAYELGPDKLAALTAAAHEEKPGSLVVGEIVQYPGEWLQSMDAVMGFGLRQVLLGTIDGQIAPARAGRMIERITRDAGIEGMLKSWIVLDNHDVPRIATQIADLAQRRLAQVLQFTLPGAPNVYYGAELGMTGGGDPANRGPMRWDMVRDDNPDLQWMRSLIALRRAHRALRVGDFRLIESDHLLAFERYTDRVLETVLVFANPTSTPVTERVLVANSFLMDGTPLVDLLVAPGVKPVMEIGSGFLTITVPARSALVLAPKEQDRGGYSRYKGVR